MQLNWNLEKYTTGFAKIDEQHKNLFEGVNELLAACRTSKGSGSEEAVDKAISMMGFLAEYVIVHFREEEELFEKLNHPMQEENKEAHLNFLEKYSDFQEQIGRDGLTRKIIVKLEIFLGSWLVNHILKVDTSLRDLADIGSSEQEVESDNEEPKKSFFHFFRFFSKNK